MIIKELILKLKKFDQELNVTLDTCEGMEFLDIDQIYEHEKGVVLYGSIMNASQDRESCHPKALCKSEAHEVPKTIRIMNVNQMQE